MKLAASVVAMTLLVTSCGNDSSSSDSTAVATTVTSVPVAQLPTVDELDDFYPTLDVMEEDSAASGGDYVVANDAVIDTQSEEFSWATGLTFGVERTYDFQSVNDDDPMQTHDAKAVFRVLMFDSVQDATQYASGYVGRKYEIAQIESKLEGPTSSAVLRYRVEGDLLWWRSEAIVQHGRLVIWVQYQDNTTLHWGTTAMAVADRYLVNIMDPYPSLGS